MTTYHCILDTFCSDLVLTRSLKHFFLMLKSHGDHLWKKLRVMPSSESALYICVIFHNLVFSAKKGDIAVPDVCIYHSQISAGLAVGFCQHSGSNSNSLCLDANHWNVFRIEFWFEFLFIGTSVAIVSLLCLTAQARQTLLRSWANSFTIDGVFCCCFFSRFPWCHPHPLPCQTTTWVTKMKHCAACCCPGTWVATTLDTIRYVGLYQFILLFRYSLVFLFFKGESGGKGI